MKKIIIISMLLLSQSALASSYFNCQLTSEIKEINKKIFSFSKYKVTFLVKHATKIGESWPCENLEGKTYSATIKVGKAVYKNGDVIKLHYESYGSPFDGWEKYSLIEGNKT